MLQIERNNQLIVKTLSENIFLEPNASRKSLDRIITDFDFTTYHLSTLPDNKELILISIYLKCWSDLVNYGVQDYLKDKYSAYLGPLTILDGNNIESNHNYSFLLDINQLKDKSEEFSQQLINELSFLKRHCMAAPFELAFKQYDELSQKYANSNTYSEEIQAELQQQEILVIKYRDSEENIYIKPSFDRVTVIFSTIFKDETDKIFGKVFLQEFVDARKRSVQTAPQVLYSHREPPLDIRRVVRNLDDENKGYVTFVLFPRHLVKGDRRENCISHIQFFRTYFHYHIKCSKAYMHTRMRFRVREFLKILNRAKPENLDEEGRAVESRKTASGRRFDFGRV